MTCQPSEPITSIVPTINAIVVEFLIALFGTLYLETLPILDTTALTLHVPPPQSYECCGSSTVWYKPSTNKGTLICSAVGFSTVLDAPVPMCCVPILHRPLSS